MGGGAVGLCLVILDALNVEKQAPGLESGRVTVEGFRLQECRCGGLGAAG